MKPMTSIRNRYIIAGDLVLILACVVGSYILRLEMGPDFDQYLPSMYWMIAVALIVKPIVYFRFGLYRRMWAYASLQEIKLIVIAVAIASIPVIIVLFIVRSLAGPSVFPPRSVLLIDAVLSILAVGGVRIAIRMVAEGARLNAVTSQHTAKRRALIVGAGDAGAMVVRELQKNPQINLVPVAFLDDNPSKQRQQLFGIPVMGTVSELGRMISMMRVDEVIIAIPSAPGRVVRLVADVCRARNVPFRTMPGIYELLGGTVSINRLREVEISDLLRREPTRIRDAEIGATITSRCVLVTGAGGSIGRELCRQIARWGPSQLIMLGHGENSIFEALLELQESYPSLVIHPVICDVRDYLRLENLFVSHQPQVVFHAAAHKHVPMMELNIEEAITNNVMGTANVVQACLAQNVERLVMISTDKAVQPANVMGASKRMAEMIVLDAAERSGRPYSVVRFGNVLGSRGSVVPRFKRQIARGGPLTITHPEMKRYFMTIPEAVYLVLQAASLGQGGETFVLNMGEQVRILDLAEDLIRLSGLEPGKDIEIVFTGIRPGEKLVEDLWEAGHEYQPTAHPDIVRLMDQQMLSGEELEHGIEELIRLARAGDAPEISRLLDELIPGAVVRSTPPPELTSIE